MTDEPTEPTKLLPPVAAACNTCPWRANEHALRGEPWLEDERMYGYWDNVRKGGQMACHKTLVIGPTDGHPTPEGGFGGDGAPRECAGLSAILDKEHDLARAVGGHLEYMAVRGPMGVTREGFVTYFERRIPALRAGHPVVRDGHKYHRPWLPDPAGADPQPIYPSPCSCPACQEHSDEHDSVELVPYGHEEPVAVDRVLAPLLEALWAAEARTLASCYDLKGLLAARSPEQLAELRDRSGKPSAVNYARVVHGSDLAFIRGVRSPGWATLAKAVQTLPDGEVATLGPFVQVTFPNDQIAALVSAVTPR